MIVRPRGASTAGAVLRMGLVPAAALAVHQLRFLLAFGHASGAQLAQTGHAYLHSLVPWLIALIGLAAGGFLCGMGQAFSGQRSLRRYTASLAALWLACAGCLIAIYAAQEFLEGVVLSGHPAGLAGIFGYGGWWAIPAAVAVGLVLAAILHGARWALDEIARRWSPAAPRRRRSATAPARPPALGLPRLAPLAGGWSDRGPPR